MTGYAYDAADAERRQLTVLFCDLVDSTPLADRFLNGITRQTIIQMCKDQGMTVHERHILPEEVSEFQECFLTGSAAEVTPVAQIGEDWHFQVGPTTRKIAEDYDALVRA